MDERQVIVGVVSGLFGVKGWVKIASFTRPAERVFRYQPWYLRVAGDGADQELKIEVAEDRKHGKGFIALLGGIDDRDSAEKLVGAEIRVGRNNFAEPDAGEYYWTDLIGLRVRTIEDRELGVVKNVMETGANDVLVLEGEQRRLVPFLVGSVVQKVDLEAGTIVVDWDPDF